MVFDPERKVVKINQSGRLILSQFVDGDISGDQSTLPVLRHRRGAPHVEDSGLRPPEKDG